MKNNQERRIITEQVPVHSSRLVAELVGRKGWKIEALQAKTNTYIKIPAHGESHVFIIAGRPQDVAAAKRELVADAIHLTKIRAPPTNCIHNQRTKSLASPYGPFTEDDPTTIPQSRNITQCVPVYSSDLVAKIVGTDGYRIKALQARTNAYIRAPRPDENPTFVITGRPDDVAAAKQEVVTSAEHIRHGDPVFVITGRPKDVAEAKRQVLAAAEYITHIPSAPEINTMQNWSRRCLGPSVEELITIYVCIPPRAVPYVVGHKGTRIKHIQELTSTCIISPFREKAYPKAMGKREIGERSKPEIDSIVARGTEGSVTDHPHSDSVDISPKFHRCRLSDATQSKFEQQLEPHWSVSLSSPPYFGIVEAGSGAPLDNPPLDTTPQGNSAGTLMEAATTTSSTFERFDSTNLPELFVSGAASNVALQEALP